MNYPEDLEKELQKLLKELEESMNEDITDSELNDIVGFDLKELEKNFKVPRYKHSLIYEKINEDAIDPVYNYPSDSGFDLHSIHDVNIPSLGRQMVSTGLRFKIPVGHEMQIRSKSGLAYKQGLMVLNSPGTIDRGYTGEIKVIIFNTNKEDYHIKKGDKIAQAVICPVLDGEVVDLSKGSVDEGERGDNGFGSTGI